jgi:hypothetical protein
MEISQGISLCSYLYLKQAKMSFFFFYKIAKLENRVQKRFCGGVGGQQVGINGREEVARKGRVNIVYTYL